jgi:hypothetical protein
MWAEASTRATDHAAIAYTVGRWARVRGVSYGEQLLDACHGLRGGAARVDRETAANPEAWAIVQARAAAYFAGTLRDPCPGAHHWGGYDLEADRKRIDAREASGAWAVVKCKSKTANVFVRETGVRS